MLCVDHDHSTGLIRGLLCKKCNFALGLLMDNIESIERAKMYLMKEKKKSDEIVKYGIDRDELSEGSTVGIEPGDLESELEEVTQNAK